MSSPNPTSAETGTVPANSASSESDHRTEAQKAVDEMARLMTWDRFPAGDRSALRRARPGDLGSPAFWKLALEHLEPPGLLPESEGPYRDEQERRWVRIVADLAELGNLHSPKVPLGRALAAADAGEARVLRLLRAEGDPLLRLCRTVTHRLATQGKPVNARDLAELVLSDGHERWAAQVRRRIARDYYRASASKSDSSSS